MIQDSVHALFWYGTESSDLQGRSGIDANFFVVFLSCIESNAKISSFRTTNVDDSCVNACVLCPI